LASKLGIRNGYYKSSFAVNLFFTSKWARYVVVSVVSYIEWRYALIDPYYYRA